MWDEFYIAMAEGVASKSKDPSTKVGAVIVDDRHNMVGMGYNGFPRGVADDERLDDRETKYPRIVHAEANAIVNAAKSCVGCTLYCTLFPCASCAGLIINAGITEVVAPRETVARWREDQGVAAEMFKEAGVRWRTL